MDGFGSDSGSMNMQLEGLSKSSKISDPDHSKSVISDENREYTPAEVLDWETQIYSEEDLAKLENDQVLDENEEKKSKSTLDSTEKSGVLLDKEQDVKGITHKEAWTMPVLINVDRFENPIAENVLICDMYIKVKTGGSRTLDRVYSQSKCYFKYLRYGLTFLEFYNKDDPELLESIELVRKGLMRVFELKIDYLLQESDSLSVKGKIMGQKDWNIRNYIVGEAYKFLDSQTPTDDDPDSESKIGQGSHVELCHYVQTDGINAQISWNSTLKCWSIGSYSVSILVANVDDLQKYPGYNKKIGQMEKHEIRYNYCHLIAVHWFRILEDIKEKEPEIDFENELTKTLADCTLVGELVGVDSIQQILSYPSESLIFSSLIKNSVSNESSMPPEKCIEFCQRWNLNCIQITQVGNYESQEDLKKSMLDLYFKVTTGPIRNYEEGVIMMLVLRNPSCPSEDRVLSCSKIKTIEYKIFKKVKDKLKNYWENYEKVTYITKKMEKEYKTKFDRFKTEVNEIFKSHLSVDSKYKKSKQATDMIKFGKAAFDNVMFDISLYNLMKTNYAQFCETVSAKISGSGKDKFGSHTSYKSSKVKPDSGFSLSSQIFDSGVKYSVFEKSSI